METCAVCTELIDEPDPLGAGVMLFHRACLPCCRFCERRYQADQAEWDFRGGTAWSDEWGYVITLQSATCPECSDLGGRRDYGSGW
jgi:hypothetical protein